MNNFISTCPKRFTSAALKILVVIVTIFTMGIGCASDGGSRVGGSANAGAVIGAGIGLLLGAARGEPAAGLAVGAAVGGAQGAYEGWKQEQDDERTRQITDAIRESGQSAPVQDNQDSATNARQELTRFLGVWSMEGWMQEPGGDRQQVSARVNGNIEMNYFVELAYIDLKVTGLEAQLWGTSTLGYDEDYGYTITNRFNTLPEPVRASNGTFDRSGSTFVFNGSDFKFTIKFMDLNHFTVETVVTAGGNELTVESYRFTRS